VFLQSASRAFSISVANVSTTAAVPAEYAELVDDAAIFPPGDAPLPDAVARHREHRRAAYAAMVGPFVVSDVRLPELLELLATDGADEPLPISVVVTGGAGGLAPAVAWATGSSLVELRGLEVALRDLDDLPGSARRVVAAAADLGTEAPVHVEPPVMQEPGHGWMTALDDIAAADLRLKFRTGGLSSDAFPSPEALAQCIDAALDRELPFKCTAGLHTAVRHRDAATGFTHHGFLNVLLATRAALDGDDPVTSLEEVDRDAVLSTLQRIGPDRLARARRWFTSFGCCEVLDPLRELEGLGLVVPD